MWRNKPNIQTEMLNKMLLIIFVSIGLWFAIWIHSEYAAFKSESALLRQNHLESHRQTLKNEVSGVIQYIRDMKKQAEQQLERELKERVYQAHGIAAHIVEQNKESKKIPEMITMIKDALRPIRFNNGRGYYFAVSLEGVEQLYPVRPALEGQNLMALQDSRGSFVIQDEIRVVKSQNEGFVTHYWTKPDANMSVTYPKRSFVKYFEPLNWYFGAGEYLDAAKEQIQQEILNRLIRLKFGQDGYFFGSTDNGGPLFSNNRITVGSGSVWELTDPDGVKIIQEQKKAAENPEGGFVHYAWHKLNTQDPSPKISFVQGIPEWGWTIGAGVYLDTIDDIIRENRAALTRGLKKRILRSVVILALLSGLAYFWSRRISSKIAQEIKTFSSALKQSTLSEMVIKPDDFGFQEFKDIAMITDQMLKSRKQVEKDLEKTKEHFRLLVENQTDIICKFNLEGLFLFVSPSFCNTFGKTRKELLGQSFMPLIHEDDAARVENAFKRVLTTPYTAHVEARFLTQAGFRWFSLMSTAVLDRSRQAESIVCVGRDIDDQKHIELALVQSEKQFRELFNAVNDLVYTQNMDGVFTSVNPAICRLFGHDRESIVGHTPAEFMKPEFQPDFKGQYLEKIKTLGYHEGISCYFKKNMEKFYIEYKSTLVNPDDGEPYISGIGREVTERILSEKRLKHLQEQIVQSQKMESIGTLAAGIAHDFNNILFPIVGHTEMLLEDSPDGSPLAESLREIYASALRARDLVKQILTFSRQTRSELKIMRLQPVIREALKLIRASIPATIQIKQDITDACGVIKADPTQIHQIVMNLSTNAYHAMEDSGGILTVGLNQIELTQQDLINSDAKPGFYACLSVADTGRGMDKGVMEKIFDPFFTTKTTGRGTGMGLSVVHGIVTSVKGYIQVSSDPGKGTTFTVFFPIVNSVVKEQGGSIKESIRGGTEQILLVDDEAGIIVMEKRLLERLGYQVYCSTSSRDALEVFRASPDQFDLVITDMAMPHMSGDKLAAELMNIRPDIPVLLCTGFSDPGSEKKAVASGIRGFLLKPVVMKELAQKIREVIDGAKHGI